MRDVMPSHSALRPRFSRASWAKGAGAQLLAAAHWIKELAFCLEETRTTSLAAETAFWLFLSLVLLRR
jgi:hypothetical protein